MRLITKMILSVIGLIAIIALYFIFFAKFSASPMIFGVSFNPTYTRYLGFDAGEVFKTILDEWKFKYIRLSAQWEDIELNRGRYNFSELDYLMNEAEKRGAKILLAVGRKTPRWPECHLPEWAKQISYEEYKQPLRDYISEVIKRYGNHPALEIWQVENEPFLPFGLCKAMPRKDLEAEISLVKELDQTHPIMVTDSGELSLWTKTAGAADLFGTTMYRVVWSKMLGYWNYDWFPSSLYRLRLWLNRVPKEKSYIVELQAEPWIPDGTVQNTSLGEQNKSMNVDRMRKNISYAEETGMPRAYLWGAEWWYWLKKQGEMGIVNYIKTLKKE